MQVDERADLGVLFVHGIGEQRRGETLAQFGEPLLAWIDTWLRHERDVQDVVARPVAARLQAPLLDGAAPAHAHVLVGARQGERDHAQNWLFAEAWWGAQVLPLRIAEFTAWLLTRGPWTLLLHLYQVLLHPLAQRITVGWVRWPVLVAQGLLVTLAWSVVSIVMNLLLIACSLLGVLPLGWVRRGVFAMLRALAGVIGDAYLLIHSSTQAAAYEETVTDALHWVAARARRVVVVAHSQGAAIAHRALRRHSEPAVAGFVSVGAGITKLQALEVFERLDASTRVAPLLAPPLLVLAVLSWTQGRALLLPEIIAIETPVIVSLIAAAFLATAWLSVVSTLQTLRRQTRLRLALTDRPDSLQWTDIASTHDPVSAGRLTDWFDAQEVAVEACQITVLRSFVADHTSYWKARASFLPKLAAALDRCSGGTLLGIDSGDARLREAERRLERDVRVLQAGKLLDLAALACPLIWARERLAQTVADLRDWLAPAEGSLREHAPFAFVDQGLSALEDALRWAARGVGGQIAAADAAYAVNLAAGALLLGLLVLLWRRIADPLWQGWSAARHAEALAGARASSSDAQSRSRWAALLEQAPEWVSVRLRDLGLIAVLMVPLAWSLLATFAPGWLTLREMWALPARLFVVFFLAMMLAVWAKELGKQVQAAQLWLARKRRSAAARTTRTTRTIELLSRALEALTGVGIALAIPASLLEWKDGLSIAVFTIGAGAFARIVLAIFARLDARLTESRSPARRRITLLCAPWVAALAAGAGMQFALQPAPSVSGVLGSMVLITILGAACELGALALVARLSRARASAQA